MRLYVAAECAVFFKTKERYGSLSNMASGFPIQLNRMKIGSSEALYQACRYPHLPDVQKRICSQISPMTAKMIAKKFRKETRSDWDDIRVTLMRWCLRVKLAQNWQRFQSALTETDSLPIVERSRRDRFWGTVEVEEGILQGMNILGRLLMELRRDYSEERHWMFVPTPAIDNFKLFGEEVEPIEVRVASVPDTSSVEKRRAF